MTLFSMYIIENMVRRIAENHNFVFKSVFFLLLLLSFALFANAFFPRAQFSLCVFKWNSDYDFFFETNNESIFYFICIFWWNLQFCLIHSFSNKRKGNQYHNFIFNYFHWFFTYNWIQILQVAMLQKKTLKHWFYLRIVKHI